MRELGRKEKSAGTRPAARRRPRFARSRRRRAAAPTLEQTQEQRARAQVKDLALVQQTHVPVAPLFAGDAERERREAHDPRQEVAPLSSSRAPRARICDPPRRASRGPQQQWYATAALWLFPARAHAKTDKNGARKTTPCGGRPGDPQTTSLLLLRARATSPARPARPPQATHRALHPLERVIRRRRTITSPSPSRAPCPQKVALPQKTSKRPPDAHRLPRPSSRTPDNPTGKRTTNHNRQTPIVRRRPRPPGPRPLRRVWGARGRRRPRPCRGRVAFDDGR